MRVYLLQAGPLVKTKIPKDPEGKQKFFGFAVYKHEVSVPYAMQLLNGTPLFGRSLHVQFRSGESVLGGFSKDEKAEKFSHKIKR